MFKNGLFFFFDEKRIVDYIDGLLSRKNYVSLRLFELKPILRGPVPVKVENVGDFCHNQRSI